MNTSNEAVGRCLHFVKSGSLFLALALVIPAGANPAQMGKAFATPEEAVSALTRAATSRDNAEINKIFGPEAEDIQNPDRVEATNDLAKFVAALTTKHELVHQSDTNYILEVG